ncbi:MAG: DUF6497 family protein [Pseudomonadota bacterium]
MLAAPGLGSSPESKTMPSGLIVEPLDIQLEPVGAPTLSVQTVRLRYVSDQLGDKAFSFERIEGDFAHLCETEGLMTRARSAPKARQIIISIASEPLVFGEISPEIIQYFDAFDVVSETCIWAGP